jgi:hypothetical protein
MAWAETRSSAWRGVLLTLAVLALVMRVAVPQGFMVSGEAGSGPQLVVCTGHGPLKTDPSSPAGKSRPDSPCAFAGHGVGAAPQPAPAIQLVSRALPPEPHAALPVDAVPGRGLAAPPPPALGPPRTV